MGQYRDFKHVLRPVLGDVDSPVTKTVVRALDANSPKSTPKSSHASAPTRPALDLTQAPQMTPAWAGPDSHCEYCAAYVDCPSEGLAWCCECGHTTKPTPWVDLPTDLKEEYE